MRDDALLLLLLLPSRSRPRHGADADGGPDDVGVPAADGTDVGAGCQDRLRSVLAISARRSLFGAGAVVVVVDDEGIPEGFEWRFPCYAAAVAVWQRCRHFGGGA